MTEVNPYLNFDGRTREAMGFYQGIFGGKLDIQSYGEADPTVGPENRDRVMHALLDGPVKLMASDTRPGEPATPGDNVHISVQCDSNEDLERFFNGLLPGAKVTMELQDTFWGARFGMLTDRYGINWMFNFAKPQ